LPTDYGALPTTVKMPRVIGDSGLNIGRLAGLLQIRGPVRLTAPAIVGPMLDSGVVVISRAGHPLATETAGGCTPGTPFQIASVSKNVAATLVLLLAEEGRLDLHEPVGRWLTDAGPAWHELTLHQLLSHSAGVGHWADVPGLDPSAPADRAERLARVLATPPAAAGRFRYSSPGYIVVGAIAERAGGQPYEALVSERILQPLGMTATVSGTRPEGAPEGTRAGRPIPAWDTSSMIGTGDIWSTATDLTAYATALDGGALLSRESLALMRTEHVRFAEPDRTSDERLVVTGYGYGTYTGMLDGRPVTMHTGDNPGFTSLVAWLPDDRIVIGLANDDATDWEAVLTKL
jgi:CubicO group peptidase (beta-lactamase class C family)